MQKEKKKQKPKLKKTHKSPGKKCDNILTGLALFLARLHWRRWSQTMENERVAPHWFLSPRDEMKDVKRELKFFLRQA